nr:hypothetical protein [Lachnospiraceae bacterium]
FVDTNISIATLKRIAPDNHTLVMLADPMISVRRFFERPDPEKQFLYRLILEEPDSYPVEWDSKKSSLSIERHEKI